MNKRRIKSPKLLIFFTFITMLIVTFLSLSKYRSTIAGSSTGRVAKYVLGISKNNIINIPIEPVEPNNSQEFYFEISNETENKKKNEVTLKYNIELENMANLPLEFKLYKYNEDSTEYDELRLNSNVTDNINISASDKINHKYKLELKWKKNTENSNYDSYKYSKTIDYIKIIVNAAQVD